MFTSLDEPGDISLNSEEGASTPQSSGSTQKDIPSSVPRTSPGEGLMAEEALSFKTGLSGPGFSTFVANNWVKAEERREGAALYSQESVEHVKSMMSSVRAQAVANLQEAHQVAQESASEKASRELKARGRRVELMDPRKIRAHPMLEGLLSSPRTLRQTEAGPRHGAHPELSRRREEPRDV